MRVEENQMRVLEEKILPDGSRILIDRSLPNSRPRSLKGSERGLSHESKGSNQGRGDLLGRPPKNSGKYSKPQYLVGDPLNTTGRTAALRGGLMDDHNDHQMKLDKLSAKFLEVNREKDAFKDTFFDEEIFGEILKSKQFFKLALSLMKYTMHSTNTRAKKQLAAKKGTTSAFNRRF